MLGEKNSLEYLLIAGGRLSLHVQTVSTSLMSRLVKILKDTKKWPKNENLGICHFGGSAIAGTAEDLTVSVLNFSKKSPLNKELFGRRFYTTFDQSCLNFFLFKIQCLSTAETY